MMYDKETIIYALANFFATLPEENRANLRWHHGNKTPVFCGQGSGTNWTDGKGTG